MEEARLGNRQLFSSAPLRWAVSFVILGFGGYSVMQESMTIGTFVILYQFAVQFMEAIQGLFQFLMQISGRMASVERVRQLLEGEAITEGELRLEGMIQSIDLHDVRFRFSASAPVVLDGVTAELPAGRKIAFVGTSGGGKSTVAQLLVRFFEPEHGEIRINGLPLNKIDRKDWAERVHIVFQEPYLFPDTIRTNLVMGRSGIAEEEVLEACRVSQIEGFIRNLPDGLDTVIGERGVQLSGGERQRLALARALLGRPELLILDEATSALDLETERQVQAAIDETRRELTTLVIAHRLSTVQNADMIYVLQDGRISECGKHAELLAADGVYASLIYRERQQEAVS